MKEKLLCLFALFLPLEQILFYLFDIDTILKPYRFFLVLALIFTFLDKSFLKNKLNNVFKSFFFIFTYGFLMGFFRIALGKGSLDYLTNGSIHFLLGLIIIYLLSNITNKKLLYKIFNYFIIGLLISSIYGLFIFIFSPGQTYRLKGFFNNPNHIAFTINFISPFLIYNIKNKKNILYIISFLFLTMIVVLSGSRTGMLIQILIFIYSIIIFSRNIFNIIKTIFITFISYYFILTPILGLNNRFLDRYEFDNLKEGAGRWDIIDAAMSLGFDTFFMGVGIGQYRFYHLDYLSSNAYSTVLDFELSTHNHFLDLLINFGFISFFIFSFFLIKVFSFLFKNRKKEFSKFGLMILCILILSSFSQEMLIFPAFWIVISLLSTYNFFSYD